MAISVTDPTVKLALSMGQMALQHALDVLKAKHANDHKVADAVNAAEAAINGAIQGLLAL